MNGFAYGDHILFPAEVWTSVITADFTGSPAGDLVSDTLSLVCSH